MSDKETPAARLGRRFDQDSDGFDRQRARKFAVSGIIVYSADAFVSVAAGSAGSAVGAAGAAAGAD
ncbi:MAG: hypothetical protein M3Q13_08725, partial [Pseudomonadota bacterium]|nr:hypothetical protein [Pseudomonadota bacterium]